MTMPNERSRAVLGAAEVLKELLDPQKHPETTEETRRHIKWALRHYPDRHEINAVAWLCPDYFERVDEVIGANGPHGVVYVKTPLDDLAATINRLSDAEIDSDEIDNLLVALKRAGVITNQDLVMLLGNYLDEKRRQVSLGSQKVKRPA